LVLPAYLVAADLLVSGAGFQHRNATRREMLVGYVNQDRATEEGERHAAPDQAHREPFTVGYQIKREWT
jgi:hypothetical protein